MSLEQQDNVRFAKFIRRYPCLYDYSCRTHSSRVETDSAWRDISVEFNASVRDCKLRWKNIRTVFRRHLFGSVGITPKKDYYLSDALKFLVPLMKVSKKQQDEEGFDGYDDDQEVTVMMELESQDTEPEEKPLVLPSEPEIILSSLPETAEHRTLETTRQTNSVRKRKSRDSPDEVAKQYYSMKADSENGGGGTSGTNGGSGFVHQDELTAKSDELFLLSLKDDMRMMTPVQKRKFKRRIYDVIDEILISGDPQPYQESSYDPTKVKMESEFLID
ncbi:uncharacterized protein LOC135706495 [Ochlerotatus camptorhynchus]|uniref:uncharacterized protein LOC135706495 n=1 Tax=Ochlerotatus camptorhynchus TaxID=644619 RepID=UPI0031E2D3B9